jgi:hypothetical protein
MHYLKNAVIIITAVWFGVHLFTACSPFTPQTRTSEVEALGERFSLYSGDAVPTDRWWNNSVPPI